VNYEAAAALIDRAHNAGDLFGYTTEDPDKVKARHLYRRLAQAVHPDRVDEWRRVQAAGLFAKLGTLWAAQTGSGASDGQFTISTRRRTYAARAALFTDDIGVTYPCVWMEDDKEKHGLMKMPRNPRDSDLMQAEADALRKLHDGEERFHPFVPQLVETFRHRDKATRMERRVNVTSGRPEGFYSLSEVKAAYPAGTDPKDAAWMWRRLLTVLGFAHQCDLVHGSVVPENVLIHPELHGLILINWCYSVPMKSTVRARARTEPGASFIAPEIMAKEPAAQGTDIYMASLTMGWLMGELAPKRLRSFVRGCTLEREAMRPHDAWNLLREYDDLLERLYGPRKFRPFRMPS
jgi:hypothetical protein